MTAIGFYHLTRETPTRALARLLARTLASGKRALVLLPDAASLSAVDDALWREDAVDFLPHGIDHAALQPVLLAAAAEAVAAPPNGADFLFLFAGAQAAHVTRYDRVFDVFDGRDADAVTAARTRWQAGRAAGHALTYWREGAKGWEQGP